ncbi:MAG TPA: protein kinase [Candidatus Nitrosopolaris rasttigaisensis]|nr:protein kinase [Candidatus Nitrosopolaris rasttigaisensis]
METLVGMTMGGYTLTRILGSGGMGTVYLAEDKAIGQQVAIKVIRTGGDDTYTEMITKEQAAERFRQEARAVASLDHLHILPLYRYGEEETAYGTQAYMVMQYRPEGSLLDWQKKRARNVLAEASLPLPPQAPTQLPPGLPTDWPLGIEEAAEYLMQAASGYSMLMTVVSYIEISNQQIFYCVLTLIQLLALVAPFYYSQTLD